ncbi:MAG: DmsE family decaheme c-type cytochrome [Thermodesulfobacteriota bacterium]
MKKRGRATVRLVLVLGAAVPLFAACAALRQGHPIFSQQEYERMLVGPIEADYVGQTNCLAACHVHDGLAAYLERSVHGQQLSQDRNLPLFDCETCHGAGSLAIENAAQDKACDTTQFVRLSELPAGARSLQCLKCHTAMSETALQGWAGGAHAAAGVSCPDCHKLHQGIEQKPSGKQIAETCFACHADVEAETAYFSRHPIREGKLTCVTCHEPHGSASDAMLVTTDAETLCFKCHAAQAAPALFEHGGGTNGCTTCHRPHGSPFRDLLTLQDPFLCLQCHAGHASPQDGTARKAAFFTRCTTCHSQIHGTDIQSTLPGSAFLK